GGMSGASARRMAKPIEPHLLCQVTGGSARVAAHASSDKTVMMQMMIASLQSAIQAAANKPSPMLKILPARIPMKKGDNKGTNRALLGGSGTASAPPTDGDHKPA